MPPSFVQNTLAVVRKSKSSSLSGPDPTTPHEPHRHRHNLHLPGSMLGHHSKSHGHGSKEHLISLPKLKSKTPPPPVEVKPGSGAPTELVILSHGLQGHTEDFNYLIEKLQETKAAAHGKLLVHSSSVNTNKTHDGIELGGLRLAEDIQDVVNRYKNSLKTISLMGFSLGGMYIRYAVGHLYNPEDGTIAGLQANKCIIVASPNLGVRKFGVYRFLPGWMTAMAGNALGSTSQQLLLRDDRQLLMEMSADRDSHGMQFVSGLRAFRHRYLYANVRNDFMVNYGTAALDSSVKIIGAPDVRDVVPAHGEITKIDDAYDEKGCKICFEVRYDEQRDTETARNSGRSPAEIDAGVADEMKEETMSARLKRLGWTVIGVDFPMSVPIAHNRIVAMSRNWLHTWMNAAGRRVVHHLVDTFAGDLDEHDNQFKEIGGSNATEVVTSP